MGRRTSFNDVQQIFFDKGCELMTNIEDYNRLGGKISSAKFTYKATCGHVSTVTLTNFVQKGSGVRCKQCVYADVSSKNKTLTRTSNHSLGHEIEHEGFLMVKTPIETEFELSRTREGCLADFMIRPLNTICDEWIGVQLKITKNACHDIFTFNIRKRDYKNCILLCACSGTQDCWIFSSADVTGLNKLNIGKTNKSKYIDHHCTLKELPNKLVDAYRTNMKEEASTFLIPISWAHQLEQHYRNLREMHLKNTTFEYPEIDARKYDFIVNGHKIQEKIASIRKDRVDSYSVGLYNNNGRCAGKRVFKCYNKGDNDFYWIWLKDTQAFFLVPESIMIQKRYVQVDGNLNDKKVGFCICPSSWIHDFAMNLLDSDVELKLKAILK